MTEAAHTATLRAKSPLLLGHDVLVCAPEGIVAEALAVALSTCGLTARVTGSLAWTRPQHAERPGAAVVVLGSSTPADAARTVRALSSAGHRVAVIACHPDDPSLGPCVEAGASAILPGSASLNDLATLVDALSRGDPAESPIDPNEILRSHRSRAALTARRRERLGSLTKRESEILVALMEGRRPSAIAAAGFVSVHTVRTQIRSILRKLDVHSQLEAIAVARDIGWSHRSP